MPCYRVYRTGSPYNATELAAANYAQVADVTYFAHPNQLPQKLIRKAHTNWLWSTVTFGPANVPPIGIAGTATVPNVDAANTGNAYFPEAATYAVTAFDTGTGQESRPSAQVTMTNDLTLKRNYNTITWTALPAFPATGGWSSAAGGYYRIYKAQNSGFLGYIGSTSAATFTDDNIRADLSSAPPYGYNPFPGLGDYPSTVRFHEQRSWWANTANHPNAIYASRSANYENMDYRTPGQADDSLAIGIASEKVNVVNQLASTKQGLIALTSNAIFSIQGSNGDYITATPPPRVRNEISRGVSTLMPLQIDSALLYQTAKSGEIRAIGYSFEIDGLKTDDVTIFARHLFDGHTIVDWAWVEKPHSAIIAIREDGIAVVLTWDQSQQVWGWTTWSTAGSYLGVCAITEQGEDRVYILVQRASGTFVERLTADTWSDAAHACYLDCAKTLVSPGALVTHLDHLEGQPVVAWVDGALYTQDANSNPLVVINGSVTLPVSGTIVSVGLPFTSEIQTLPLVSQTRAGWSIAKPQDGGHVVLKVVNTSNLQVGPNPSKTFDIKQRQYEVPGTPTNLFTGHLNLDLPASSGDEVTVYIKSTTPAPMEIVGVMIEPNYGDLT